MTAADDLSPELVAGLVAAVGVTADEVRVGDADGTACLDVPHGVWAAAVRHLRDEWQCRYFDWLSGVDQTDDADAPGVDIVAHVVRLPGGSGEPGTALGHVLLRTRVPASDLRVDSVSTVFAGAAWHERETHEMFGVDFTGFDDGTDLGMRPLLLPDGFEGTPLRKEFQLASRAAKPWPGAKEPGESHADTSAPSRRKLLPPGVPDAETWGPRRAGPGVVSAGSVAGATEGADVAGDAGVASAGSVAGATKDADVAGDGDG